MVLGFAFLVVGEPRHNKTAGEKKRKGAEGLSSINYESIPADRRTRYFHIQEKGNPRHRASNVRSHSLLISLIENNVHILCCVLFVHVDKSEK